MKIIRSILCLYDIIIAVLAVFMGVLMIMSKEIFSVSPMDLISLNFESWLILGIVVIIIFGLGNILSAIFTIIGKNNWIVSTLISCLLIICIFLQIILLGEWYLVTVEFLLMGIIQLILSGIVFLGTKNA